MSVLDDIWGGVVSAIQRPARDAARALSQAERDAARYRSRADEVVAGLEEQLEAERSASWMRAAAAGSVGLLGAVLLGMAMSDD